MSFGAGISSGKLYGNMVDGGNVVVDLSTQQVAALTNGAGRSLVGRGLASADRDLVAGSYLAIVVVLRCGRGTGVAGGACILGLTTEQGVDVLQHRASLTLKLSRLATSVRDLVTRLHLRVVVVLRGSSTAAVATSRAGLTAESTL